MRNDQGNVQLHNKIRFAVAGITDDRGICEFVCLFCLSQDLLCSMLTTNAT